MKKYYSRFFGLLYPPLTYVAHPVCDDDGELKHGEPGEPWRTFQCEYLNKTHMQHIRYLKYEM